MIITNRSSPALRKRGAQLVVSVENMNLFNIIIVVIFLGFIASGTIALRAGSGEPRGRRTIRIIAVFALLYGALAFFAQAFSATGGARFLPTSFEWLLATVSGVVKDSAGQFIAPHTPSGRIQVYDQDKKYLRGWAVDAGGGLFKLHITSDNLIEVFTARGSRYFVFREDGAIVREGTYTPKTYSDLPAESDLTERFKTPLILLPFSHPFAGWALGALGMLCLIVLDKTKKRSNTNMPVHSDAPKSGA